MDPYTLTMMLAAFFACILYAVNPFLAIAFCALVGGNMTLMQEGQLYPVMVTFLLVGGAITIVQSYQRRDKK